MTKRSNRGRHDANWFATSYWLAYSLDGTNFTNITNAPGRESAWPYPGNTNHDNIILNFFQPVLARYIRLTVAKYSSQPAIRWNVILGAPLPCASNQIRSGCGGTSPGSCVSMFLHLLSLPNYTRRIFFCISNCRQIDINFF